MRALTDDVEKIVKLVPGGYGISMTRTELEKLLKLAWSKGAEYYIARLMKNLP